MSLHRVLFALVACVALVAPSVSQAEITVEKTDRGVTVNLDGKLFTEYLIKSGSKPILWPIVGPTGVRMTRSYPMETVEGEKQDHVHHRSLWFTHGDVDGVDFWAEPATYAKAKAKVDRVMGEIKHREFKKVEASGDTATIVTVNDWIDQNGKKHCEDTRTITFRTDGKNRIIDFDVEVRAGDEPVSFNETKEGSFGVRVPTAIDVKDGPGHIVTSEGRKDKDAWGKPARWVDYYGPIDGKVVGVAIMNHPSSLRHPTSWHVRDYGLFTANPFGGHEFNPDSVEKGSGKLTLEPGQSFVLKHRVLFHEGDAETAGVAAAYDKYAK